MDNVTTTLPPKKIDSPSISILTAAFNRRTLLERLYFSLCAQTSFDFEWIVIDDGSTDGTSEYIRSIIAVAPFRISFCLQQNGGKHRAINRAISLASGSYSVIVDSDDRLFHDAIYNLGRFIDIHTADAYIFDIASCEDEVSPSQPRFSEFRYQDLFRLTGDKTRLIRTEIFREFKFCEFPNESFLTEAVVWIPLHLNLKFSYCTYQAVRVEYQADGLSAQYKNLLFKNPRGSLRAAKVVLKKVVWSRQYAKFLLLHLFMGIVGIFSL